MAVVFIHGVNVRKDHTCAANLIARTGLSASTEIVSPYWGGDGVTFAWNRATVPSVGYLESVGEESVGRPSQSDLEFMAVVRDLAPRSTATTGALESAGPLKAAARSDLPRFVEALLAPINWSKIELSSGSGDTREQVGRNESTLAQAALQVANDPAACADVASAVSFLRPSSPTSMTTSNTAPAPTPSNPTAHTSSASFYDVLLGLLSRYLK